MARTLFRVLIGITLAIMALGRYSRGGLPAFLVPPFFFWFGISVFVFGAFGIYSLVRAWREPRNRRALLFDVLIAAAWVPYWFANVRK